MVREAVRQLKRILRNNHVARMGGSGTASQSSGRHAVFDGEVHRVMIVLFYAN
jgi:hypothetical protein